MEQNKRVPVNYAVTREQKRYIAKINMLKEGKKNICKHDYITRVAGTLSLQERVPSFFAEHWKEYVNKEWETKSNGERN